MQIPYVTRYIAFRDECSTRFIRSSKLWVILCLHLKHIRVRYIPDIKCKLFIKKKTNCNYFLVYNTITQKTHIILAQIGFNGWSSMSYIIQTFNITNDALKEVDCTMFNKLSAAILRYNRTLSGLNILGLVYCIKMTAGIALILDYVS